MLVRVSIADSKTQTKQESHEVDKGDRHCDLVPCSLNDLVNGR